MRVKLHEGNTVGEELNAGSPSVPFEGGSDMISRNSDESAELLGFSGRLQTPWKSPGHRGWISSRSVRSISVEDRGAQTGRSEDLWRKRESAC